MPIKSYFRGSGEKVMASMKKKYGDKKGENVFYGVANSRKGMKPGGRKKKPRGGK
jgi:hypothetical protein